MTLSMRLKKLISLLSLLIMFSGCSDCRTQINNRDLRRSIFVSEGTIFDWREVPREKWTDDMLLWEEYMLIADPNNDPNHTQVMPLKYRGSFFCDDILNEIAVERTSEDLRPNLGERIWDFVLLRWIFKK